MAQDLVIRDGLIVDGSGRPAYKGDLGVSEGRILEIGSLDSGEASELIDASGLAVAPGFIDMHSHSDFVLLVNPKAESKVRQGVTTEVVGNCGGSAAPILGLARDQDINRYQTRYGINIDWESFGEYLSRLDGGIAVNVASLVGHGTVRKCVMDLEERAPSQGELEEMKDLVDAAMREGAFGMSTGLVYPPGRYADTEELVELCRVVAGHGGFYASHIRGERETMLEALGEAIEIGERVGVAVQVSHHPAKIGAWGRSSETLAMMDEADWLAPFLDACTDAFITAAQTQLDAIPPLWGGFFNFFGFFSWRTI